MNSSLKKSKSSEKFSEIITPEKICEKSSVEPNLSLTEGSPTRRLHISPRSVKEKTDLGDSGNSLNNSEKNSEIFSISNQQRFSAKKVQDIPNNFDRGSNKTEKSRRHSSKFSRERPPKISEKLARNSFMINHKNIPIVEEKQTAIDVSSPSIFKKDPAYSLPLNAISCEETEYIPNLKKSESSPNITSSL